MTGSDRSTTLIRNGTAKFLIFTGEQNIEACYEDETVWLRLNVATRHSARNM